MANLPDERDQNLSLLSALLAAEGDPWNFPAVNRSAGRPSDRHKTLLVSLGSANGLQPPASRSTIRHSRPPADRSRDVAP